MREQPISALVEPYVAASMSTSVNKVSVVEHKMNVANTLSTTETNNELNANDYPGHPALQQKINDHLTLRYLRAQYFHTSHECSNLKAATGIAYFDPYAASIRTKPSRNIIAG